jgi:hypothetical protein
MKLGDQVLVRRAWPDDTVNDTAEPGKLVLCIWAPGDAEQPPGVGAEIDRAHAWWRVEWPDGSRLHLREDRLVPLDGDPT